MGRPGSGNLVSLPAGDVVAPIRGISAQEFPGPTFGGELQHPLIGAAFTLRSNHRQCFPERASPVCPTNTGRYVLEFLWEFNLSFAPTPTRACRANGHSNFRSVLY